MVRSMGIAAGGIQAAIDRFARVAERTARTGVDGDIVRDTVDSTVAELDVRANIQVIRASDEMAESLLHVIA